MATHHALQNLMLVSKRVKSFYLNFDTIKVFKKYIKLIVVVVLKR